MFSIYVKTNVLADILCKSLHAFNPKIKTMSMRIVLLLFFLSLFTIVNVQNSFAQKKVQISKVDIKSYNGSHVSCAEANDGEITVTAKGGSGKYEYSKNEGDTYQSKNVFTGLIHNTTYAIFVRDKETKEVSSGKWVTLKFSNPVTISSQNVTNVPKCLEKPNGALSVTANGGTGKLKYSLDYGTTFQKNGYFGNLREGIYQVMVQDDNGCSTISEPIELEGQPVIGTIVSKINVNCKNPFGSVTIKISGSDGSSFFMVSLDGQEPVRVAKNDSYTFTNLAEGAHQITMLDNYTECKGLLDFEITGSDEATIHGQSNICAGNEAFLNIQIDAENRGRFTAVYQDKERNNYTLNNLVAGDNIISLGKLSSSKTFTLVSVKSPNGCWATVKGSASIAVNQPGKWLGYTNDWYDPQNWTCGKVPTSETNVTIGQTKNVPEINKRVATVNSLSIENGASLKVNYLLQISGYFKNDDGVLDVTEGSLEFNGEKEQKIYGFMFKDKTIRNLIVSNTAGLNVNDTPGDTLNITGDLTFGTETATLFTGDNITLKSTISGTANIGVVGNRNYIKGKFIVERYINTGTDKSLGQHGKAWILLATPTIGSTIYESWQESGKATGKTPIAIKQKGFGTLLTTAYNKVPANGFDLYTGAGSSIKTYQSETGSYDNGPVSTNEPVYNEKGYMIMVRGDRSIFTSRANANPVVLRTKGEIITGTTHEMKVPANKWTSIGNPYASRIYINGIQRTGGVDDFIVVWDPKLGGSYGLGGFQTLYKDGANYYAIPGGGSYGKKPVLFIESGQAFFVQATKRDGTIFFTEDAKRPSVISRTQKGAGTISATTSLKTNLYALGSGEAVLADGNLLLTGDFNNDMSSINARKLLNSAENFYILSSGDHFAIQSRNAITGNDTLYFNMTGMRSQKYRLEMTADLNMPGMQAWLKDAFLKTETPLKLNGTTDVEFTVSSQPGAAAANRFMVIFRPALILPVTFSAVKATLDQSIVLVEWKVETESNLKKYEVEKSLDGKTFSSAATVDAYNTNGGKYHWLDQNPASGYNYYRIRSVDLDGKTSRTKIVKIKNGPSIGSISVYPNPIAKGTVHLQLGNQPAGVYNLRLLNPVGQVLLTQKINHLGGNHTEKINWDHSMSRGVYTLEISNIQTGVKIIKVMY